MEEMSDAFPDQPGMTIAGRYRVEGLLGRGGMAAVYRVGDLATNRVIALKRSYARNPAGLAKRRALLEREYYTLSQLAHPNIVETYDFGSDAHGPFYTMELLEGADLHDSSRLPWTEACLLLRDVASALAMLHARGFVHRDLSARNVRRTLDGRAKLFDFGAMAAMGVNASVVGTPPFLAPEAFQMQALDARADLFALGALGYLLLTGRHAYPARSFDELRDTWRSQPASLTRLRPDLPATLGALITQLLALDRGARPRCAADVIGSLSAIAKLPTDEQPAVWSAYLTTPTLVGRDAALVEIRKRMLTLVRGDGTSLLIEGVAGAGRSRLLDACALEGKLVAATVLRADARDAAQLGAWGVARTLIAQLQALFPGEVQAALRLSHAAILPRFLAELAADGGISIEASDERARVIRELRDLVLSVAQSHRLLLLVDDLQRCDEPSVAWLSALSHKTERHALMVVAALTLGREQWLSSALRLMRATAERLMLSELSEADSAALLGSLFGDVPHLAYLASRVHHIAHGNPRTTLELAQHLVDTGRAQYASGAWRLPASLDDSDLPHSLASSLESRVRALSADAFELVCALAAGQDDELTLSDCVQLSACAAAARTYAARNELLASRIIVASDDGEAFRQQAFVPVIMRLLAADPERSQSLHSRLADLLARRPGDSRRVAHHLLLAGREPEAVQILIGFDPSAKHVPLPLSQRALSFAQTHALPDLVLLRLRQLVLVKAVYVLEFDAFRRHWSAAMTRIEQDCGLSVYAQLHAVPQSERLMRALTLTQERYAATPEHERGLDVLPALRELALIMGVSTSFGTAAIDSAFLRGLPDVAPLIALSPVFDIVDKAAQAARHWVCGRYAAARRLYEQILERLAGNDRAGLDAAMHESLESSLRFLIAQLDASAGASVEDAALALGRVPEMRASAWQLRQVYQLSQGNLSEARKCMRRAELMRVQDGQDQYLVGMTSTVELLAAATLGEISGVKTAIESMQVLAEATAGWRPLLELGQARLRQLQGDLHGALEHVKSGFASAPAGEHLAFALLASAHIDLLVQLGAAQDAVERGSNYLLQCSQHGLEADAGAAEASLAAALVAAGRAREALPIVVARIEEADQKGRSGVSLGILCELRARIAFGLGEQSEFAAWAQRCAFEFGKSHNPALTARFARLIEDARTHDVDARDALMPALARLSEPVKAEYETLQSRMRECADAAERARCALTLLLQDVGSYAGVLIGVLPQAAGAGLRVLASIPEQETDPTLLDWAQQYYRMLSEFRAQTTITRDELEDVTRSLEDDGPRVPTQLEHLGRRLNIVSLSTDELQPRTAAILIFQVVDHTQPTPRRRLASELAEQLLDPTSEN